MSSATRQPNPMFFKTVLPLPFAPDIPYGTDDGGWGAAPYDGCVPYSFGGDEGAPPNAVPQLEQNWALS